MNYYIIPIALLAACVIYDAFKMFSKPTEIDCGEYTVKSKDKKELQTANMVQYYHFNVDPLFRAAFEGYPEDATYLARNMFFDLYKARGGFVEAKDLRIILSEVKDIYYREK